MSGNKRHGPALLWAGTLLAMILGLWLLGIAGCGSPPNPVTDEDARLGEDQIYGNVYEATSDQIPDQQAS